MKSQEIRLSYKKAYESFDAYGDRIVTYTVELPVKIWLTTKDIVHFSQLDFEGLQYDYVGITRDRRPEKQDLIDEKRVVYKVGVNRWTYLFLQDMEGDDDE